MFEKLGSSPPFEYFCVWLAHNDVNTGVVEWRLLFQEMSQYLGGKIVLGAVGDIGLF